MLVLVTGAAGRIGAHLRGTFNLLAVVRQHAPGLRRFAYASSDAVYWRGADTPACYFPVDESHPRLPGTVYGALPKMP